VELPPAPAARVVDSTGAGDVLVGTTAAHLGGGAELLTALRRATAAARSLAGAARRPQTAIELPNRDPSLRRA
jgi:sugar/nucleoside kinase (ribokinase family)